MVAVGSLNHVTLSVAQLEQSFEFYARVLGFRPLARWKTGAYWNSSDFRGDQHSVHIGETTAPMHFHSPIKPNEHWTGGAPEPKTSLTPVGAGIVTS